jgi:hypothetical protein
MQRSVFDIPIKINITARKSNRVFRDKSANLRVIPTGAVEMQSREIILLASRVLIPCRERICGISETVVNGMKGMRVEQTSPESV